MKSILFLLPLLLTGCTVHPGLYNDQTGEHVFLGGSLGSKTTSESAVAVSASGTTIGYTMEGKDETVGVKYYFMEKAFGEIANAARQAYTSGNATKRVMGEQSVRRAGISADKAVRLRTIETTLPEATTVIPTTP